ncbi:hypothetical protein [Azospirillum largimobile]
MGLVSLLWRGRVGFDCPYPDPPPLSADLRSACRVSTKRSFVRELGGGGD